MELIDGPSSTSDSTPRVVYIEDDSNPKHTPRERPAVSLTSRASVIEAEKLIHRNEPEGLLAIEPKEEGSLARERQQEEIAKVFPSRGP